MSQKYISREKSSIETPYIHSDRGHLDQRAIYGFIVYIACFPVFVLYVIWAYVPHEWLNSIGITYLPSKYWAVTAPISALILSTVGLLAYTWNNRSLMQPLTSIYQIKDDCHTNQHLNGSSLSARSNYSKELPIIPLLSDLDLTLVTNQLYLKSNKNMLHYGYGRRDNDNGSVKFQKKES
ncbi:unnamed protein product [Heterobilharzia americana]|nr:unnamed protein product [Heterobilharzia americana]CAH8436659.1 unnamed protein product [Heterobilharzia americana]